MKSFPQLGTTRVRLIGLQRVDVSQIVLKAGNKKIADTIINLPHPYEDSDAIHWIDLAFQHFEEGKGVVFAIRMKSNDELIGGISLTIERKSNRAELGYWIAEHYWNQGLATEAVEAIIRFGFESLQLNKITSSHFAINPASGKVMTKNGMLKEGELIEQVLKDGQYHTLLVYGLTRAQYLNR